MVPSVLRAVSARWKTFPNDRATGLYEFRLAYVIPKKFKIYDSVEFIITFKVVIFISLSLSPYNSSNGLKFKLRVQQ